MKKHASSHGLAMLICTICSGWLAKLSYEHYPFVLKYVEYLIQNVVDLLPIHYSPRDISTLIIAVVLAMIWGLTFAFLNKNKS